MDFINSCDVFSVIQQRKRDSDKRDYGKLLSVTGSKYYRGAALLSSLGALRSGVGILCLASLEEVILPVSSELPETTFLPLTESNSGTISSDNVEQIIACMNRATALLCGCGLGVSTDSIELVRSLCAAAACPVILDADALNIASRDKSIFKSIKNEYIITPHYGEMARLTGIDAAEIAAEPEKSAEEFSQEYGCVTVLKGPRTVITSSDGKCRVSLKGNPGLSRGGSGDLLAGMIASFAAQGIDAYHAAQCGVYLHGAAADRCAVRKSEQGMLPHDIVDDLCDIFRENNR